MMLRAVPDLTDFARRMPMKRQPVGGWSWNAPVLASSRSRARPAGDRPGDARRLCERPQGRYVLEDAPNPKVILIGTGSEVWPCVDAKKLLEAKVLPRA